MPKITPLAGGAEYKLKWSPSRVLAYKQYVILSPTKALPSSSQRHKARDIGGWASSSFTFQIHLVSRRVESKLLPKGHPGLLSHSGWTQVVSRVPAGRQLLWGERGERCLTPVHWEKENLITRSRSPGAYPKTQG